jgi:SAM-dependent methyltransferase
MEVPYEKQTLDNPNPIARFAHRARFRKSKRLVMPLLQNGGTLLDYGCGQGRFLHEISAETMHSHQKVMLLGYDPYAPMQYEGYVVVSDPAAIADTSIDVMSCLEVCEHLTEAETHNFVQFASRVLKPKGRLLVTVPIMIGPAVLIKELSRSILFRRFSDTSPLELFKAAVFGVPPTRADDIKASHRGYDWRVTLRTLSATFQLEKLEFSPLPLPGWYGQSQALMLFKNGLG